MDKVGCVGRRKGERGHFLDIGAGGKGAGGTCQNNSVDGGGRFGETKGGIEFGDEGGGECVESFGTIERYWRSRVSVFVMNSRKEFRHILCATPVRGSEVSMNSYFTVENSAILGRAYGLNCERGALGRSTALLNVFSIVDLYNAAMLLV